MRRAVANHRWGRVPLIALVGSVACSPSKETESPPLVRALKRGAPTTSIRARWLEWSSRHVPFGDYTTQLSDPEKHRDLRCSKYPYLKVDAVGAIMRIDRGSPSVICSAVAIKADRIITARHCLWARGDDAEYYFVPAPDAYSAGSTQRYRLRNPRGYAPDPSIDIGTVDTEAPLPAMAFPELATDLDPAVALSLGTQLLKVGYGVWTHPSATGELISTIGDRSCATVKVRDVTAGRFTYDPLWPPAGQVCSADSGGPALVWQTADAPRALLIGITSTSPSDTKYCGRGGTDARVPGLDRRWLMD